MQRGKRVKTNLGPLSGIPRGGLNDSEGFCGAWSAAGAPELVNQIPLLNTGPQKAVPLI